MPRWIPGLLIGTVTLLATACVPLTTATPFATAQDEQASATINVTSDARTQVDVVPTDVGFRLDVTSESGIGTADVTWEPNLQAPISLRLHVNGLEEFRFAYNTTEIVASISSSGNHQISQALVGSDGAQQPITADSPFWLTIEPKNVDGQSASSIPLEGGYFDVTPPADFVDNPSEVFKFSWIDFYR